MLKSPKLLKFRAEMSTEYGIISVKQLIDIVKYQSQNHLKKKTTEINKNAVSKKCTQTKYLK
jgi:hypothetical protein